MKTNEESVEYTRYKELILKYGEQVKVFEEKLSVYKAQIAERTQGEENYKALEGRLLELRRQYLNQEALKQVDKSGNIEFIKTDTKSTNSLIIIVGLIIVVIMAVIINQNNNAKPKDDEELDAE